MVATVRLAAALAVVFAASGCGSRDATRDAVRQVVPPREEPAASLFVAPSGSDAGACTSEAPCRSLARAHSLAAAGDVIELAAGRYPAQEIAATGRDGGSPVVVRPATGAQVTLAGLTVAASHVEVRNLEAGSWRVVHPAADVTLRDVDARIMNVYGASRVRVYGGRIGPYRDGASSVMATEEGVEPRDVLIDGVAFHDYIRTRPEVHMECLYVASADGITIRRSTFRNCAIFDVFFTQLHGGPTRRVVLENNWLDAAGSRGGDLSRGFYSFVVAEHNVRVADYLIRNNSLLQPFYIAGVRDGRPVARVRVVGNAGPLGGDSACADGVAYSHNVWSDGRCGATDMVADPGFADPGKLDLRLAAGAAAVGAGDPRDYPGDDIAGRQRPEGGAPDAGAWERPGPGAAG